MSDRGNAANNRCLVWFEDREETVNPYKAIIRKQGFHIHFTSMVESFLEELEKSRKSPCVLKGIILDIQILQAKDLKLLQPGLVSQDGNDVGWLVARHYLRDPKNNLQHIPLLFLTVQPMGEMNRPHMKALEAQAKDGLAGPVERMEKFLDPDSNLEKWLKSL